MKKIVFAAFFLTSFSAYSQDAPQAMLNSYRKFDDSTLVKIVKGIDGMLKERYKKAMGSRYLEAMWRSDVTIMNGKKVEAVMPIDSVQSRYHFLDIRNVTVSFDESSAFYGIRASMGVIKVYMKDPDEKQKK